MQQYRLLRNNKESGPFSWQDLVDIPLRAYDLVWVEGKSISWKYPSELDELRPFAPPAPDDLYVQFHTPSQTPGSNVSTTTQSGEKKLHKKYVSVILPAGRLERPAINEEIPPVNQLLVENTIAYTPTYTPRQYHRYYIAGALLILLAGGIYFGTRGREKNNLPVIASEASTASTALTSLSVPVSGNTVNTVSGNTGVTSSTLRPIHASPLEFAALKRHLDVLSSKYSVGVFGGISNLEITVMNTGKSAFRNIVVAVDYLKKDKTIYHTEKLTISYLAAGSTRKINPPPSAGGIAFQTRIVEIDGLTSR
ncbi:hypothetical protein [Flavihumibacter petaseus]|uniref:GYF domain-containing protein n=1 Tax=Flavihumibacter petaseus NBRC 106054 TaxID=1220578 RepID=A0A0E9N6Q4_9BACT|nr:hypothetical protein [Flavihumibacter petaseus]GAO45632.1 hypothetical protein FPE01S_07_00200 [Flavihumibacter petaseus NBRC 106054]